MTPNFIETSNELYGNTTRFCDEDVSEEAGDAFFEHDHFVFHAGLARRALQQLERLIEGLMRKAKGSVVHGYHPAGLEIEKGLGGVGGIGMDVAALRRSRGAEREQREGGGQAACGRV